MAFKSLINAEAARKHSEKVILDEVEKEWNSVVREINEAMSTGKFNVTLYSKRLKPENIQRLTDKNYKIEIRTTGLNESSTVVRW